MYSLSSEPRAAITRWKNQKTKVFVCRAFANLHWSGRSGGAAKGFSLTGSSSPSAPSSPLVPSVLAQQCTWVSGVGSLSVFLAQQIKEAASAAGPDRVRCVQCAAAPFHGCTLVPLPVLRAQPLCSALPWSSSISLTAQQCWRKADWPT